MKTTHTRRARESGRQDETRKERVEGGWDASEQFTSSRGSQAAIVDRRVTKETEREFLVENASRPRLLTLAKDMRCRVSSEPSTPKYEQCVLLRHHESFPEPSNHDI